MIIETSQEDNREKKAPEIPDSISETIEPVDSSALNGSVDYVVSFSQRELYEKIFVF